MWWRKLFESTWMKIKIKIFIEDKWSQTRETAQQIQLASLKKVSKNLSKTLHSIISMLLTHASNGSCGSQYPISMPTATFVSYVLTVSRIERKEKAHGLTKIAIYGGKFDYWPPLTMGNVEKRFSETAFKQEKSTAMILKLLLMILFWLIVDPGRHSSCSANCRKPGESNAGGALQTVAVGVHAAPSLFSPPPSDALSLLLFTHISPLQCACVCVCVFIPHGLMVSHHISPSLSVSAVSSWLTAACK